MTHGGENIRREFPILASGIAYLDNAATTQKPRAVLDAMQRFYETHNANINRGVHALGESATVAYDDARRSVARFIGAKHAREIIFTRNATEAINLVARTYGEACGEDDVVALTMLEHHANIVPWLQLRDRTGTMVKWIDVEDDGTLRVEELAAHLAQGNVKIVAVTAVSNVLGIKTPLEKIIAAAHDAGAVVLVDAAQLAAHDAIDVRALDADFLVFSGHKMYGPTGIGVLYGKESLLDAMPPFLGGGDMIGSVTKEGFTVAELPRKFEAGTPPIAEAVGLRAAIEWIECIGRKDIVDLEKEVIAYALEKFRAYERVRILGPGDPHRIAGCFGFVTDGIHAHDLTQLLSEKGVMMRAGHHCAQPLHDRLGITASSRLSVAAYTEKEDIDRACSAFETISTAWPR